MLSLNTRQLSFKINYLFYSWFKFVSNQSQHVPKCEKWQSFSPHQNNNCWLVSQLTVTQAGRSVKCEIMAWQVVRLNRSDTVTWITIKSHVPARKENEKRYFIIPKDKTKISVCDQRRRNKRRRRCRSWGLSGKNTLTFPVFLEKWLNLHRASSQLGRHCLFTAAACCHWKFN